MFRSVKIILSFLAIFSFQACNYNTSTLDVDLSDVQIEKIDIRRYGKTIFSLDTSLLRKELINIQDEFPVFLNGDLDDPVTIKRMYDFVTDEQLITANSIVQVNFEELDWLEDELYKSFQYLKYYFPEKEVPEVYTYVSGYDYEYRAQYYNDNLIIALDMYLGKDYPVYKNLGLPSYVLENFSKEFISRDCLYEIGRSFLNYRNIGNNLLAHMLTEGKLLYIVKALKPDLKETILFNYTPQQMEWVTQNESLVWAYIIENEMLYSSNPNYRQKFILDSPFTSYFGSESPARLGNYIGFKIIESYMEENKDEKLKELVKENDIQKILKRSKYKPNS